MKANPNKPNFQIGRQRTEDRGQKTEDRGQKTGAAATRCPISDLCKIDETYKFAKNMRFTVENTPKQV
ncbi:hypothetical protein ES703_20805 [subsurface metagenome]